MIGMQAVVHSLWPPVCLNDKQKAPGSCISERRRLLAAG